MPVVWPALTSLFRDFQMDIKHILSKAERTYLVVKSKDFVSRQMMGYPPFSSFFSILITGEEKEQVAMASQKLADAKAFAEEIPNTTKFIIAQRISSIQNADRIIVMENGEVNGFGTHEELLENNAIYREVYESQTKGGEENE